MPENFTIRHTSAPERGHRSRQDPHPAESAPGIHQLGQRGTQIERVAGIKQADQTRTIQVRMPADQPRERLDAFDQAIVSPV